MKARYYRILTALVVIILGAVLGIGTGPLASTVDGLRERCL